MTAQSIARDLLLNRLIEAKSHNLIKILVGMRRCGKSFLLFKLFKQHLLDSGITPNHIIEIDLESDTFAFCRNAITLGREIRSRLPPDNDPCFVLIDEIQHAEPILPEGTDLSRLRTEDRKNAYITFYHVLNGLLKHDNISTYVTGSNAHLLSKDVATEFRGRSEVINIFPLSLAEFTQTMPNAGDLFQIRDAYLTFGGLPECALLATDAEKKRYLDNLNQTIYLRDVIERFKLRDDTAIEAITDIAMSNIGCLTNPTRLSALLNASGKITTNNGKRCRKRYEVDFVINRFDQRFYIQSAWDIPDNEKREQETFSLRHIGDNFRKVVVTGNPYEKPWTDKNGITFIGIIPFLIDPKSIETL